MANEQLLIMSTSTSLASTKDPSMSTISFYFFRTSNVKRATREQIKKKGQEQQAPALFNLTFWVD